MPPGWEGHPPRHPIITLADLHDWLQDEWDSTLATEMGGAAYWGDALDQAARAIRNCFRVLAWLGVEDRPERPLPAETLAGAKQHLDGLECWVRQKVKDGWAPPRPSATEANVVSPTTPRKRRKGSEFPDDDEINILIIRYLRQHPGAPISDIVEAINISQGKVDSMDAWKRETARRKAAKPLPKIKERQLTKEMLAAIGQKVDPAIEKVMKDDAIWQWMMKKAKPNEKADLHMKTAQERESLVELVREQYDEEHVEPDD